MLVVLFERSGRVDDSVVVKQQLSTLRQHDEEGFGAELRRLKIDNTIIVIKG